MYNRLFVYSAEQKKQNMEISKASGRTYEPGSVVVSGRPRAYTDIVTNFDKYSRLFGDAQVVAQGDIRKISFTDPKR